MCESQAVVGHLIQSRRLNHRLTIATQFAETQIVGQDQDNVGLWLVSGVKKTHWREQQDDEPNAVFHDASVSNNSVDDEMRQDLPKNKFWAEQ